MRLPKPIEATQKIPSGPQHESESESEEDEPKVRAAPAKRGRQAKASKPTTSGIIITKATQRHQIPESKSESEEDSPRILLRPRHKLNKFNK